MSAEGRVLAEKSLRFLLGQDHDLPDGVGIHDGRRDLRGLTLFAPRSVGRVSAGGVRAEVSGDVFEFRDVHWQGLDLSHALLSSLRFFGSVIADCRLDGAVCRDWRLWDSQVKDSFFVGSDLRDAAIGTWHAGRTNVWRNVVFEGTDLRGALARGCLMEHCLFSHARLKGVAFQQATMRQCRFSGSLEEVLFDGREIPGRRPEPGVFVDVDFSEAAFEDVDFRGARFEGVTFPRGVYAIPRFPGVARRARELLGRDESLEARMLRGELDVLLTLPGAEDSWGVFNRSDYVVSGGDRLADLAESLFMEAAQDSSAG